MITFTISLASRGCSFTSAESGMSSSFLKQLNGPNATMANQFFSLLPRAVLHRLPYKPIKPNSKIKHIYSLVQKPLLAYEGNLSYVNSQLYSR